MSEDAGLCEQSFDRENAHRGEKHRHLMQEEAEPFFWFRPLRLAQGDNLLPRLPASPLPCLVSAEADTHCDGNEPGVRPRRKNVVEPAFDKQPSSPSLEIESGTAIDSEVCLAAA